MARNGLGGSRTLLSMPPRHGKTKLCSVWLPTTYHGLWPDRDIILATYGAEFSAKWGRQARNNILQYGGDLGVALGEARSGWNWETSEGGAMVATGVGGDITGRGAHLLVIDDPVKNAEDALSEVYRERAYDWWQSVAASRLEPGASALCVMTRWHEDDLGGRLLADGWEEIRLPAVAEDNDPMGRAVGEALWPGRYDRAALDRIREERSDYWWTSMYQQRPRARTGGMIDPAWIRLVDEAPPGLGRAVRWWDLAATKPSTIANPDYLVGVKMAERGGEFVILHIARTRLGAAHVPDFIAGVAGADGRGTAVWMPQEPGASGKLFATSMARRLREFTVRFAPETGDKTLRAEPFAAKAAAGLVSMVRGPWVRDYLDELAAFPSVGKKDDQVDATSGAYAVLLTGGSATLFADAQPSGIFERKTEGERLRAMIGREREQDEDQD